MKLSKLKLSSLGAILALSSLPVISCAKNTRNITWDYSKTEFNGFVQNHEYIAVKNERLMYAYDSQSATILHGYNEISTSFISDTKNQITRFYFDEEDFLINNEFGKSKENPKLSHDGKNITDGNGDNVMVTIFNELQVDPTDSATEKQPKSRYRKIRVYDVNSSTSIEYTYFTKVDSITTAGYYKKRADAEANQGMYNIEDLVYKADFLSNTSSTYYPTYYTNFASLIRDNDIQNYKNESENEKNISGYWAFTKGKHNYFSSTPNWNDPKKIVTNIPEELKVYTTTSAPKTSQLPALLMFFKAEKTSTSNRFTIKTAQVFEE